MSMRNYIREDEPMTTQRQIDNDFDDGARFMKGLAFALGLTFLLIFLAWCALWPAQAHAQTTCTAGGNVTCFGASKSAGESPLATTLTWNVVGASSCTAGGAGAVPAWSGSVPVLGTRNLTGIRVKMTLTLDCVAPATGGKMRLSWTPPTQNTDGSPLTNLGGYVISYGTATGSLTQTISLAVPSANTFDVAGLTAGTWYASLQAATLSCFPATLQDCRMSVPSNVASMAVTTSPGGVLPQLSVVLDAYAVPKPPTAVIATDAVAYEIRTDSTGKLLAQRIGVVKPGTACTSDDQQIVAGVTYSRVEREAIDVVNFSNGPDAWVPVVYARCT